MVEDSVQKVLDSLIPGDLLLCEWCDASTGKISNNGGVVDIPVSSWGVYVGLFGNKNKHIILAQNSYQYSDGLYDVDYTAIPLGWALNVKVIIKGHYPEEESRLLVSSFLNKDRRVFAKQKKNRARTFQMRLITHDGLD